MNTNAGSWLSRNKWILVVIGIPVLTGTSWAFRPEKLFINHKVNEATPFASGWRHSRFLRASWRGRFTQRAGGRRFTKLLTAHNICG